MLAAVAIGGVLAWLLRGELQLDRLVSREAELLRWRDEHFWLAIFLAGLVYALVTGLSIPGATLLTLVTAWLFGFWPGRLWRRRPDDATMALGRPLRSFMVAAADRCLCPPDESAGAGAKCG